MPDNYQRVKLTQGPDGSLVDIVPPDADGKVATGMLPAAGMVYNNAGTWDRCYAASAFGDGASGVGIPIASPRLYNEGSYDRQRGNTFGTALAGATRTTLTNSANFTNYNARGIQAYLTVTAASGTGGLSMIIAGVDVGGVFALHASVTPVTATGVFVYEVYPGVGAASGGILQRTSGILPRTWFIQVAVGNASSYTYGVDYSLIV